VTSDVEEIEVEEVVEEIPKRGRCCEGCERTHTADISSLPSVARYKQPNLI